MGECAMDLKGEAIGKYWSEPCPDGYGVLYRFKLKTGSRKAYIGITGDFPRRFVAHVKGRQWKKREESVIHKAIQKHGIDNFDVEILDYLPDDKLLAAEIDAIAMQGTLSPNGYNLEEGGSRARATQETKKKRSDAMKKVIQTKSTDEIMTWRANSKKSRSSPTFKFDAATRMRERWSNFGSATQSEIIERARESRNAGHLKRLEELRKQALPFEPVRSRRIHGQLYLRPDGKVARANINLKIVAIHARLQK